MLGKLARVVLGMAKGVLIGIGTVVVVVVLWVESGDGKPKAKEAVPVPMVQAEPVPERCACSSGAVCTGPRGGQYCLDEGGRRRYK